MPQIPYTGVQSVSPQLDPTPRFQVDASPAVFGVNVAQAIEGMGKTVDGVGNEIFARGMAMQDLYNHSTAQQADADYMQKTGELHAQYSSLQGKQAVDAYPQYIKDLQKARTDIRDQMPNDMAAKMFDSTSLSTMGRTIFNGAGHAATENKSYSISAANGRIAASNDQALAQPADDVAFKQGLTDVEAQTRFKAQAQGWAPEAETEAVAQAKSGLWSQRIQGLAKSQPLAADKMLKDGVASGDIRGEDIGKLTNLVQSANHTVGARMISHEVMTGAGNRWGEGEVDLGQAKMAISKIESGSPEGNYSLIGPQTKSMGVALGRYQVMSANLPDWLQKSGLPPMGQDEFLKNKGAQDQVFSTIFGGYMKKYGSANAAAVAWFSGEARAADPTKWSDVSVTDATPTSRGTSVPSYLAQFNVNLAQKAPLAAQVDMGSRIATERTPDDPLLPDFVRDRITTDHSRQTAIARDDSFQNRQVIETSLMGGADQSGKLPTSVEELTADPKAAAAWDYLSQNDPAAARRYMGVMAHNAKGDHNWTDDTLRQYQQLKGESATDPASFIDQDVIGSNLPNSAKRELINLQGRLKGQATGDPRVGRALGILAPDLQAAGINKATDKDGYNQFVGTLADQIQEFTEENKRPPKVDEVKTIGSRLMQGQVSKGWLWNSTNPTFAVPVPDEEAEKIKAEPAWGKMGITPTDAQVQRIYTRKLYQDLYGGKPKSAGTDASGPQVGTSR